ncbi:MAG: T9SS type A sorting domain-containing protein [Bacteroidetes bacterium]|nr:T9SS type A sorting domain-containing protein [Bacteroidota bacterium]
MNKVTSGTLITVTIPVVVHVVYNTSAQNISDAQIQSQITVLNQDFRRLINTPGYSSDPVSSDTQIEFFLATTDPNGNATNGITRTSTTKTSFTHNNDVKFTSNGGQDYWDNQRYLNIWVCNLSGGLLGYAQFPEYSGTNGPYTPSTDGVVIHYGAFGNTGTQTYPNEFDKGRTATHEVGHWLGLRHTWGDVSGCGGTDYVEDTPKCSGQYYSGSSGSCDKPIQCDNIARQTENYMDYSYDGCMNIYTIGQTARMHSVIEEARGTFLQVNYTVKQVNSTGNPVGSLAGWNGSAFSSLEQNASLNVISGSSVILKGDQTVISDQKYQVWKNIENEEPTVKNHHEFIVKRVEVYTSQFKQVTSASLKTTVDGFDYPAGSVQFRDPWLIDYADPAYANTLRNRGMADAIFKPVVSGTNNLGTSSTYKGVFKNLPHLESDTYYKIKSNPVEVFGGLTLFFLNWQTIGATIPTSTTTGEQWVTFTADNAVVTANYKAMMASKSSGWVQSTSQYSGNGTKAIVCKTPNGTGEDVWLHTESSAGVKETWVSDVGLPDATNAWPLATADYNGQKQYYAEMMIDKNTGLNLTIEEYVNGQRTSILLNDYFYLTDLGASSLSLTAKVYVSPYANTTGFPATYTNFLVVVVDGLKVYSKVAVMNNGAVYSWGPWSTFTATSAPVVSTNGKTMYINWIENGNLVGRRYLNTSWGSTYTLYSNSGGNFINFTTAVNSTDDLVLMMTRQNTGSQVKAICFGKRYISGSSAPITVLESSTYGGYSAYSLAAEGTKLLVSVGKTPDGETPMSYYLWKNDGTTWTKETTVFSSTPARLLHNEVDVRPYEFATATTPALYALKTSPVSWGGNGLEKVDQETGLSVVAARLGDTLTWYTTVDPVSVDSMLVDTTGLWHIVVKTEEAREILISGLNRFGSAVWVDSSRTVQFTPAEARYTFWVVDPTGNKMRYAKDQADPEEAEFKLEDQVSVFPNPFNPATVFSVTVAEPSRVKLHIYNVIGQQVAEIVNTDLTAGVHDYRLNAGSWASGTYFYRLQIGDKLKSGKIQLVK